MQKWDADRGCEEAVRVRDNMNQTPVIHRANKPAELILVIYRLIFKFIIMLLFYVVHLVAVLLTEFL